MSASVKRKLVPPDGGWAWAIATAFSLYFFLVFSVLATFGLIYKGEFKKLGFTGTQSSFILSANGGFSMLTGLMNSFLLKKFGTRTVSICSGILVISGLILTAYSTKFWHFLISYGLLTSFGVGMGLSSYSLALNTYFQKKRDKVTGYCTAIYGTGTILFPQFVSFLLANYNIRDTMLIIAAACGNTLVAAMLLQPVEWHMKEEETQIEKAEPTETDTLFNQQSKENGNLQPICSDMAIIHASMNSLDGYHYELDEYSITENVTPEKKSRGKRVVNFFVKTFDLHLLSDAVFLIILIGLSIDFFVEFNFLWIIPFVLMEGNLSVEQTATFMSIYAIADICARFVAPHIASVLKRPNRIMFMISLLLVVSARLFLIYLTNYIPLLCLGAAIGTFRGMRLVYWSLVIPEYIATDRISAAFGLLFTFNGLCMFTGGPILGILRDMSGNYKSCIVLLNTISLTTVTMWTLQLIYQNRKAKKETDKNLEK